MAAPSTTFRSATSVKELIRPYYLKWLYFRLAAENRPPAFTRWLDFPSVALDGTPESLLPDQADLPDVIFLPMADWHGILQRSQQLARGLAAIGHRCLYLNPHLGREFPQPYLWSKRRLVTWLEPGILELHVHLTREPVFHHRCLLEDEVDAVERCILRLLESIRSKSQIIVTSFPLWAGVAERLRTRLRCPIVYDCHDLLGGFTGISSDLIAAEEGLIRSADLTVFSADWLAAECDRKLGSHGPRLILRNGVDAGAFQPVPVPNAAAPVTIGYAGSLNSWFDVEAMALAARRHPEWRFLLIGPIAEGFERHAFDGLSNVEFVGEVRHAELSAWMAQFTVATIPFLVQPLTMATNPIKMYEYFACGLPLVSARLGEVERYGGLAYIADSPREFVDQLELAARERDAALRQVRRQVAEKESWAQRARSLSEASTRLSSEPVAPLR